MPKEITSDDLFNMFLWEKQAARNARTAFGQLMRAKLKGDKKEEARWREIRDIWLDIVSKIRLAWKKWEDFIQDIDGDTAQEKYPYGLEAIRMLLKAVSYLEQFPKPGSPMERAALQWQGAAFFLFNHFLYGSDVLRGGTDWWSLYKTALEFAQDAEADGNFGYEEPELDDDLKSIDPPKAPEHKLNPSDLLKIPDDHA